MSALSNGLCPETQESAIIVILCAYRLLILDYFDSILQSL